MELAEILNEGDSVKPSRSRLLLVLAGVTGGLGLGLTVVSAPFVFPFFRRVCLPYVPATTQQVENVLEALRGRSGSLIDLGSGDGRIVIAAAQKGFESRGIELNPWLVAYSKAWALYEGLQKKAKFSRSDLWKFELKPFDNVVIFGVESMMDELEKKFARELREDSRVVACRFPLNNFTPIKTVGSGIDQVWVYKVR